MMDVCNVSVFVFLFVFPKDDKLGKMAKASADGIDR